MNKNLLSLYDFTGNWSVPYKASGWEVVQVDILLGQDILTWDYLKYQPEHFAGILAAQPCTAYALAGARWWPQKDADGTTAYFNSLTYKTLEIIQYFWPGLMFWALENPIGRIAKCVPELAKYRLLTFDPCDYGEAYTKKTVLYGEFRPWLVRNPVKPIKAPKGHHSIDLFKIQEGKKLRFHERAALRSETPAGFAQAFFNANN